MSSISDKISWQGKIISVQPRIRLLRSFDQRSHSYLGYALRIRGTIGGEEKEFLVGIGKSAQAKYQFRSGDLVSGKSVCVADPRLEPVDYYKTSGLRLMERGTEEKPSQPPWTRVPPEISVYRSRGHRRLSARIYEMKCLHCMWGCRMPVEMIIDQWKPWVKRFRFETFCYGPKSCPFYRAGPTRKVPGRRGMTWEEEDWVDEDATSHRNIND
jgi:hypothetical protein